MTVGAVFSKDDLAASHHGFVACNKLAAARRVFEMKRVQPAKEGGNIAEAFLGRAPKNGILLSGRDLKWALRLETDQAIVQRQPILGEHSDIHIHPDGGTGHADGICPIL